MLRVYSATSQEVLAYESDPIKCAVHGTEVFYESSYRSLHPQRFEDRTGWIGIEAGLEFSEEFPWYCRYVADTGHRQEQAFGTRIGGNLERFRQILDGDDVASQAHRAQHHHLRFEGLADHG